MKRVTTFASVLAISLSTAALADTSGKKIALSNNYAGNSWRQACCRAGRRSAGRR